MKKSIIAIFCFFAFACGGSSGGGGTPFYGGIWDFAGSRFLDDCNLRPPANVGAILTVNQDNNRVVVNSGQIVLTGETNNEDGFTVTHSSTAANGCQTATAYAFHNASDGVANAGLAMIIRCGAQQCQIGYGGQALKRGRAHTLNHNESIFLEDMLSVITDLVNEFPAASRGYARSAFEKELDELAAELAGAFSQNEH